MIFSLANKKFKFFIILTIFLIAIALGKLEFNFKQIAWGQTCTLGNECSVLDPPQCNGNIMEICKNCDADPYLEWCEYINCADLGSTCNASTGMCANMPAGVYCSDGTPANTCVSGHAPQYCDNSGQLVDNCGQCGCSNNWVCSSAHTFCCDNQCNGACSITGCAPSEDPDCGPNGCCGDGTCNAGECSSCPSDCTLAACCGNGNCDAAVGENSANCFADCHNCANSGENNYYLAGQSDCNLCDHPGDDDGDQGGWTAPIADQCDSDCGTVAATVQQANYQATESNCADHIDNDCDGQIDCADSDCGSDPACACTVTCNAPNQPNCQTTAPANSTATADVCCGSGEACYVCQTGYTWNGSDCILTINCHDTDGDLYVAGGSAASCGNICGPSHNQACLGGNDCDDSNAAVNPGAAESGNCADHIDNDCDGQIDCADSDCGSDPSCACAPDGCNGNCPANCGGNDDPDCSGACLDCTCSTDNDCTATCAGGDSCCAGCTPADPDCGGTGTCILPATLPCIFP